MRKITQEMIRDFKIMKLGYDFMGYPVTNKNGLSFHHLIVPHRLCRQEKIPSEGFVYWNGAILRQLTSHDYLHAIEHVDLDIFNAITSEMIDMNTKGYLDIENLRYIDDCLDSFERDYSQLNTKKGKSLIKYEYTKRFKF